MMSIRKLGVAVSAVAIGGAALAVGLSAGTAHAQSADSISLISATTTYSDPTAFPTGTQLGSDQVHLTFSVTCPAVSQDGQNQRGEVYASADQGGNGSGTSAGFACTGSAQTVQVTVTSSGAAYAAGQAFVGGTLYLNGPTFISSTTGQAVWGAVAGTGGIVSITEGTAS
jgi:hypothetical protein